MRGKEIETEIERRKMQDIRRLERNRKEKDERKGKRDVNAVERKKMQRKGERDIKRKYEYAEERKKRQK